jgi:predicted molibdopterin-dependent oxidoreductase YjgC
VGRRENCKMRVEEHPILGALEERKKVTFYLDGQAVQGYEGEPIAAALRDMGVMVHRYTPKQHKPRGIFCAIGRCTDCVMIVDGKRNIRTCITPLKAGMQVQTQDGIEAAR